VPPHRAAPSSRVPRSSHRFGGRAAIVLAVLVGLFGMHALTVGHDPMTMAAAAARPTAQTSGPVVSGPVVSGMVTAAPGYPGAGSAEHTGHTGMAGACVAVLGAAVAARAVLVSRRALAHRRSGPGRPAPAPAVASRVMPRVLAVPRALSLFELCVLRV